MVLYKDRGHERDVRHVDVSDDCATTREEHLVEKTGRSLSVASS